MNTRSAKAKGRRLQNEVAEMLYQYGPDTLRPGDIKPILMGGTGKDIIFSPLAEDVYIFDIECKNQEKLSIWKAMEQAEANTDPGRVPLVVFRRNRSKTYACLEFEALLKLLQKS